MSSEANRSSFSRRSFLQLSAAASAALAFRVVTEPELALAALPNVAKDSAVMINANENPLGPCAAAREALAPIIAQGGRYRFELSRDLVRFYAQSIGVPEDYVSIFPGSSNPLHYTVMEFCSPSASFVTADPSYEAGMHAADGAGARVVKVPLTKTYAHDVRAMVAAAPDAGVLYICSPNNPTGTLTSHADVEWLLANKPKKSVVLVDEAYIHFCDAPSTIDLAKAGKDIVVLRTFSKLYGMAGLRCGFAIARPDVIEKLESYGGGNPMPVAGVVAASASLQDPQLVARSQAHQCRGAQPSFRLARSQRLLVHSFGLQLLHAQYRAAGKRGDRGDGPAERHDWTSVAGDANLFPYHRGNSGRDGTLSGRV